MGSSVVVFSVDIGFSVKGFNIDPTLKPGPYISLVSMAALL